MIEGNRIAGVVILYNPIKEDIDNINTYVNYLDRLYIFDNSMQNNEPMLTALGNENIEYEWNGDNLGLPILLNRAIEKATKDQSKYLLCMDQDSYFNKENLEIYLKDVVEKQIDHSIAQFGLSYTTDYNQLKNDKQFSYVDYVITSASIIRLDLINKHNIRFDEKLFIDAVDFDFSFQIMLKGLKNVLFTSNSFCHKIGTPIRRASIKTLFLYKKSKNIHSPLRVYYMKRNALYLNKKYNDSNLESALNILNKSTKSNIKRCILYSENPFKYLGYLNKAKRDFRNNKMGRIDLG